MIITIGVVQIDQNLPIYFGILMFYGLGYMNYDSIRYIRKHLKSDTLVKQPPFSIWLYAFMLFFFLTLLSGIMIAVEYLHISLWIVAPFGLISLTIYLTISSQMHSFEAKSNLKSNRGSVS